MAAVAELFIPASVRFVHLRLWLEAFQGDIEDKHRESEWMQGQYDALRKTLAELDYIASPYWRSSKVGEDAS